MKFKDLILTISIFYVTLRLFGLFIVFKVLTEASPITTGLFALIVCLGISVFMYFKKQLPIPLLLTSILGIGLILKYEIAIFTGEHFTEAIPYVLSVSIIFYISFERVIKKYVIKNRSVV